MKLQVTLSENAQMPTRGSKEAAGLDLYALQDMEIKGMTRGIVETGVACAIPKGYYGRIAPRSGLALKYGIDPLAGVVDSDYRAPIKIILQNLSPSVFKIAKGDRIAQLIITPFMNCNCEVVESLDDTLRGVNGFGSSGK